MVLRHFPTECSPEVQKVCQSGKDYGRVVDCEDDGEDLWDIWYRDLANIFQGILEDLTTGKISVTEAQERLNQV